MPPNFGLDLIRAGEQAQPKLQYRMIVFSGAGLKS